MKLCIAKNSDVGLTETFIRAHVERLPAPTVLVSGSPPRINDGAPLRLTLQDRVRVHLRSVAFGGDSEAEYRAAVYTSVLRQAGATAVLAEYGPTGVLLQDACERLRLPLVVHFHGYDASANHVLDRYRDEYQRLFRLARALIAVSHTMREALIGLGAEPSKVYLNPCGVDVKDFQQSNPGDAPPVLLAVGRLTEKKAPHLLLLAFAQVQRQYPEARLRIIGDGPLQGVCQDMITALSLDETVTLLGAQSHDVVRREMQSARALVQHSVTARGGDTEGTPVAVMEAGAVGLPVVATRHAGIPDVVVDNQTGLLVRERDVDAMAEAMGKVIADPALTSRLGAAGRVRVEEHFSMDSSLDNLWKIIQTTLPTTYTHPAR